ncbi:MAG: ATP-binding protein [Desulfatitalea sp.]|nr:AAA family ATPase [Desulfatitalea sp.]NNJ99621.1 ATP-binding protein [Desulfatitalea sp.]
MNRRQANARALESELAWFNHVLETRIGIYFQHDGAADSIHDVLPPPLTESGSFYHRLVHEQHMSMDERIVLLLALIPHIRPQVLDTFFIQNKNFDRGFTEFGGLKGHTHSGFLPTGETAAFILAGDDLEKRFDIQALYDPDHFFARKTILRLEPVEKTEPFLSGALTISAEYLSKLTTGLDHKPDYNIHFPAKLITTQLDWKDLVLSPEAMADVSHIATWLQHGPTIRNHWGLGKVIKPGYRCLFYGPPGTGKTLTATLVGKTTGVDVYRIDLSKVVSKYIGETEKNLAGVFDQAVNKNWILFFDEADALFGKRTQTSSAHDRYANQEVSYLLQRIEDYPGVVILATNLKDNIDEAFARRFQSTVYFPIPDADQRLQLWRNMDNGKRIFADDVDLHRLATDYELSGGAVANVVCYSAILAMEQNHDAITQNLVQNAIAKELRKEGKTI